MSDDTVEDFIRNFFKRVPCSTPEILAKSLKQALDNSPFRYRIVTVSQQWEVAVEVVIAAPEREDVRRVRVRLLPM